MQNDRNVYIVSFILFAFLVICMSFAFNSSLAIADIIEGKGMFSKLGEEWFDDYWMNYKKITIPDGKNGTKKITNLQDFVKYRKGDTSLIVPKHNGAPKEAK